VARLKRGGGISVYRGEETQSKYAQDSRGDVTNMKSLAYGLIKISVLVQTKELLSELTKRPSLIEPCRVFTRV
jgi:hypothetical protein